MTDLKEIFGLVQQHKLAIRTTDTYKDIVSNPLWFELIYDMIHKFSIIRVVSYHGDPNSPRTPVTLYDFLVVAKRKHVWGREVGVELLSRHYVPSEVDFWAKHDAA